MSSSESPLMTMLGAQMRYLTERQSMLAQNVSNIDTPGYLAKDLKPLDFGKLVDQQMGQLPMHTTSGKHMTGASSGSGSFKADVVRKNFEVSPTGNSVSLDEEMAKISRTGADYQIASSLYKKFTALYRTALGNR